MLFEQTMWRGLATRLVRLEVPPYFAMQIAAACYPNGAKKAMQGTGFVFATPIVSPQQAALAVSRFEEAGPKGAPELFVPILVVLFGQKRVEQWREELLQADAEAAADARGRQLEAQFEAALRELGLPPTASLAAVQAKYKSLCKQFHPDRNQHESEAIQAECHRRMVSINNAYEVAVAWLEIAKTASFKRRPPKTARDNETPAQAGPTPPTATNTQHAAPPPSSPPWPKRTDLGGRASPGQPSRRLSAFPFLGLVALCVMGLIGVVAVKGLRTETNPKPQSVSTTPIASLRSQIQSLDTQIQSAEHQLLALRSKQTAAMQATTRLTSELKRLRDELPAIERALERANRKLAEALKVAAAYEQAKNPRRRSPPLSQEKAKTHEMATADLAAAMDTQRGLAYRVSAGRTRLKDAPKELAAHQAALSKNRESLGATEQQLVRMKADRDRLQAQLAAAESRLAAELSAKGAAKRAQDAGLSAEVSRDRQSADVPAFVPRRKASGRGLDRLPPAIRLLILAEAAGLDTGVDLLPDEDGGLASPPIVPPLSGHGSGWPQQVPLQ